MRIRLRQLAAVLTLTSGAAFAFSDCSGFHSSAQLGYWQFDHVESKDGTSLPTPYAFDLSLYPSGYATPVDGCNRLEAKWAADSDTPLRGTMKLTSGGGKILCEHSA